MANSLFKFWSFHSDELGSVSLFTVLSIHCLRLLYVQYLFTHSVKIPFGFVIPNTSSLRIKIVGNAKASRFNFKIKRAGTPYWQNVHHKKHEVLFQTMKQ
jgi:hypothetical protein